jgi:hypothetical protein
MPIFHVTTARGSRINVNTQSSSTGLIAIGEESREVQNLSFLRWRHFRGSGEKKAVCAILAEGGSLPTLQTAEDLPHQPKKNQDPLEITNWFSCLGPCLGPHFRSKPPR